MSLSRPQLAWQDGTPVAEAFGDVYFHKSDGLAETRYVFLDGNDLSERLSTAERFVVGETGFGTGLNFLALWRLWRRVAPATAQLHFITLEGFPLRQQDLAAAHAAFPELADLSDALVAAYPPVTPTSHRLLFDGGRVTLDLHFGEAGNVLRSLSAEVDAWFLDGFAPSKNPDMWRPEVLNAIAQRTKPGGTLATFTAAGTVRRGLSEAGFDVAKRKGFGHKRDMVTAIKPADQPARDVLPRWSPRTAGRSGDIAIIGGGLAGCALVEALVRRGHRPVLFERRDHLAREASGNAAGLVKPLITPDNSPSSRYYSAAFAYLGRLLSGLGEDSGFRKTGLLDLEMTTRDAERFDKIVGCGHWPEDFVRRVDAEETSDLFGLPLPSGGLFFAEAGWLSPPRLCARLAQGAEIRTGINAVVEADGDGWRIEDRVFPTVIFADGMRMTDFAANAWLGDVLHPVRGQTSRLAATGQSRAIRCPLHAAGYILPELDGAHVLGATFQPHRTDTNPLDADHRENLAQLHKVLPDLFQDATPLDGRAALRTCAPDHLPVVGPLFEIARFGTAFKSNPDSMDRPRTVPVPELNGLYCLTGLGSRGIVGAPLAAELLAAEISGEPLPLPVELITALRPARFAYRALKRRTWKESWDQ